MGKTIAAVALTVLVGCVSAPRTATQTTPHPLISSSADLADFRAALEETHAEIIKKNGDSFPVVHADAALAMPIPDHPSIGRALELFTTELHHKIQASLNRSASYKRMIDAALDEHHLPRGLAYLPVIESAYIPTLTSRAGAHGIWQFMPETGREYGLRTSWWIDERAHPEKSTRAAAAYLRDLYAEFRDWPLALAAYNCGPGKVRRALRERNATTFWQLAEAAALPRETRGYVPTFFATLIIVSDPAMFGFTIPEPRPIEHALVSVDGPVSLAFLASIAGLDETGIRSLNPELRRGVTPPGRHHVRVPASVAEIIADRGEKLREEDPFVTVASYTLRGSQTIGRIAKQLGLEAGEIAEMNRGYGNGRTIYLPVRQHELSLRLTERYVVKHGDTLFKIAKAHGLTVTELRELNNLPRNHVIRTGQRLVVSTRSAVVAGN